MFSYIFQLGRKNILALSELEQVLQGGTVKETSGEHALIEFAEPLKKPQRLLDRLGGTIKISKAFEISEKRLTIDEVAEKIFQYISKTRPNIDKKFPFAISLFNVPNKDKNLLKKFLKSLKNILKDHGIASRFINNQGQNAHNVAVWEENLIETGIDLSIVYGKGNNVSVAETIAIQDFKSYSDRDYGKPARDSKKGMLPPKLAQMMINLSGVSKEKIADPTKKITIYDPFCGSGTLLMEAVLMGYDVAGSDIDPQSIEDTQKNITWLKKRFGPENTKSTEKIFLGDVTKLENIPQNITAVVAESWLGPPLKFEISELEFQEIATDLEKLHTGMFERLTKLLPKGTPFVLAIPAFRIGKNVLFLKHFPALLEKFNIQSVPHQKDPASPRDSFVYDREDQLTLREIWVLKI